MYTRGEGAAAYRKTLAAMEPQGKPGAEVVYSDLNFLVLGDILETIFTARAGPALLRSRRRTGRLARGIFRPPDADTAATEKGDRFERAMTEARGLTYAHFRDGVVRGEVHDGNAFRRGGVAASAGLFGAAADVYALARTWLEPDRVDFGRGPDPGARRRRGAWRGRAGGARARPFPRCRRAPSATRASRGRRSGSTRSASSISVLLTNRIHPEVREIRFNEVRQRFHAAVYAAYA